MPSVERSLRDLAIPGFLLTLAVLIVGAVVGSVNVARLADTHRRVAHTHEVVGHLEAVLSTLADAETGQRGYLLTGDVSYLEPYDDALGRIGVTLAELDQLTSQNPEQQANLVGLREKIALKLDELARTVGLTKAGQRDAALAIVRGNKGRQRMDDVREHVTAMRTVEEDLLRRRVEHADAAVRAATASVLLPAFVGAMLVGVVFYLNRRNLAVRQRANEVLERARAEAEAAASAERDAREAAEAASRAKDAFLATVSHELRTPLSPILTWARMLRQDDASPAKRARGMEVIERCARTQAQLVEDLLDVSRIVAGKMRLEVRPVTVAPVIERAVEIVRPAAEAKDVRMEVVLDAHVGPVLGDAGRLQQVVWNLLSNAVKFTPRGGRLRVALARDTSHAEIAVSDTGQGIAPAFVPHVFERFQQADTGTSRAYGGLGLGLAIVRHIVEAHGGTVRAESPGAGQGAVFTVRLPLVMPRAAGDTGPRYAADGGALQRLDGLRVLVVDDEPDSNEAVGDLLASRGADVRAAASAPGARDVLASWTPDVLVSDVGMPGEDGYGLIASLRAGDGRGAQIPAVALTAYASREDKVRLLSAGFQAHVPKPVDGDELIEVIASLGRAARRA